MRAEEYCFDGNDNGCGGTYSHRICPPNNIDTMLDYQPNIIVRNKDEERSKEGRDHNLWPNGLPNDERDEEDCGDGGNNNKGMRTTSIRSTALSSPDVPFGEINCDGAFDLDNNDTGSGGGGEEGGKRRRRRRRRRRGLIRCFQ
jgi:hypothetical protein